MTIDINQYTSRIEQKQQQLQTMLHDGVASIVLPSAPKVEQNVPKQQSSKGDGKNVMIAGGAAVVGGLIVGDPLKWILVGAGVAAVLYGAYSSTQGRPQRPVAANATNQMDYVALASRINRSLSKVNNTVLNSWNEFIGEQKDKLKNEILASDADTDAKDRMLNAAMSTSVIELPISSFTVKINAAANAGDVDAFKSVLSDYETAMSKAISAACAEQITNWKNVK